MKKILLWNIYYCKVPYWEVKSGSYVSKVRPVLVYNFSGGDAIVFELTSNQDESGKLIREARTTECPIKTSKYGIIKATKPLTINKEVLSGKGISVDDKVKRRVRAIVKNYIVLPETTSKI